MIRYLNSENYGRGVHEWLDTRHHFSFADYYNPNNINFGALRVVNDDLVKPKTGFGPHPHENMEIISYVVDGELTHGDSMGNQRTLERGHVQYMSAGTGVIHSERNLSDNMLRFLQVWILPDDDGYEPNYGDYMFNFKDREGTWLPVATWDKNETSDAPIKIHQDMNVYATVIMPGGTERFDVAAGRQAYLVLIEGDAVITGTVSGEKATLKMRDAAEITEESIGITTACGAHIIVFEMRKE
jgi:redox-sensitive bicupin YhaK (pirin superfamily)